MLGVPRDRQDNNLLTNRDNFVTLSRRNRAALVGPETSRAMVPSVGAAAPFVARTRSAANRHIQRSIRAVSLVLLPLFTRRPETAKAEQL
jgi:hypothetical protein